MGFEQQSISGYASLPFARSYSGVYYCGKYDTPFGSSDLDSNDREVAPRPCPDRSKARKV
jgi:hypothetical protein